MLFLEIPLPDVPGHLHRQVGLLPEVNILDFWGWFSASCCSEPSLRCLHMQVPWTAGPWGHSHPRWGALAWHEIRHSQKNKGLKMDELFLSGIFR